MANSDPVGDLTKLNFEKTVSFRIVFSVQRNVWQLSKFSQSEVVVVAQHDLMVGTFHSKEAHDVLV